MKQVHKQKYYVTRVGRDTGPEDDYHHIINFHTLRAHTHASEEHGSIVSTTFVMPAPHRKHPLNFIKNFFEFYTSDCGHEHDCCGCVCRAYVTRIKKLNRRDWNVHVIFCYNI